MHVVRKAASERQTTVLEELERRANLCTVEQRENHAAQVIQQKRRALAARMSLKLKKSEAARDMAAVVTKLDGLTDKQMAKLRAAMGSYCTMREVLWATYAEGFRAFETSVLQSRWDSMHHSG